MVLILAGGVDDADDYCFLVEELVLDCGYVSESAMLSTFLPGLEYEVTYIIDTPYWYFLNIFIGMDIPVHLPQEPILAKIINLLKLLFCLKIPATGPVTGCEC